ncbi:MAG: septal ring lytic transglycosylase RlpA family protein [Gammaproteobacteria bacterium]|nr:septal ring lytic transglycosylase RlpA family protein [Gammaproteobacteria bacterium]
MHPRTLVSMPLLAGLWLGGCGTTGIRDSAPEHVPVDPQSVPNAVPRDEPRSKYGNPRSYEVFGKRYTLLDTHRGYRKRGIASWYGTKFHGRRTSSGEPYDMFAMTAAHKTLPIPCYARVTNLDTGKQIIVRVNDRGPFHPNRIIDLSYVAAAKLDMLKKGTARVEVEVIDPSAPKAEPEVQQVAVKHRVDPEPSQFPEAVEASSVKNTNLYLQVAAYAQKDNAEKARAELIMMLDENITIRQPDGDIFKLWVGPLETVEDADRVSAMLGERGYPQSHVIID